MAKANDIMFQAERDAGGVLAVMPCEEMEYDQLWLVGRRGELLAKVTVPDWHETPAVAQMIVETIEFVSRKKRRPVTELWVHIHAADDLALAMQVFAEQDIMEDEPDGGTDTTA